MSDTNPQVPSTNSQHTIVETGTTYKRLFVYASVLNVTLGALFFGYVMSAFNPIQEFVKPHGFSKPIPKILITLMTSFVPLGAGIGALTAGKIASAFGRRKPIMVIDFISIIGTILTLLPSEYSLLFGRLIQGYCVGANSSLVPLYINEISPSERTGKLGTFNQLLIAVGILVVPIIGLGMPDGTGDGEPNDKYFLVVLGIAGVFPVMRGLLTFFVFRSETPKYLLSINDEQGAKAILSRIYTPRRAEQELINLKEQKEFQSRLGKVTLKQIISPRYRKRLFVGVVVAVLQQLSGVNAIIFFSNSIFSTGSDAGTKLPTIYTIVYAAIQVFGVLVAGFIIEKLGRRRMLIGGMLFSAVMLGWFGILGILAPTSPIAKFLIWAYMLGFGVSLGPLPWVYISDILPDIGIGIGALWNWITVFIIGLVFPSVADGGMGWAFIFFALCSLLGFFFMLYYVKETNGKSETEIARMFGYKGDVGSGEQGRAENVEQAKVASENKTNIDDTESVKSGQTDNGVEKAKVVTEANVQAIQVEVRA